MSRRALLLFLYSISNYNLDIAKHSPNIYPSHKSVLNWRVHPLLLFSRNSTTSIVLIHPKIIIINRSRNKDIQIFKPATKLKVFRIGIFLEFLFQTAKNVIFQVRTFILLSRIISCHLQAHCWWRTVLDKAVPRRSASGYCLGDEDGYITDARLRSRKVS